MTSHHATADQAARATRVVRIRPQGPAVERVVAELWRSTLGLECTIAHGPASVHAEPGVLSIDGGSEDHAAPLLSFTLNADGSGEIRTSQPHWLYFLASTILEKLPRLSLEQCAGGLALTPAFPWLRNLSDHLVGSLRLARHFSAEEYVRQLAAQGYTHVAINGLGVPRPFESGPPGDMYFWFYDYSPDMDQFVDSELIRGYYPPDYLSANLKALKNNAALARRYGLVPGLHIASPRSMPEEFWNTHGYLRGARIDHPRETFRPRYTLAMAHPVVQEHYRSLLRALLREVPELGFIHVWTNDSGAGFEFVSSLYAGRNGGPYLLREWKSHDEIARAAARNVLTYYQLLRDEGRRVNGEFRVICDLAPFFVERPYIIPGLGNGLDAGEFASFERHENSGEEEALAAAGALVHAKLDVNRVIGNGLPYPGLVFERLTAAARGGTRAVLTGGTPRSLAPYDVNGEVVRALQRDPSSPLADILRASAAAWVGEPKADALVAIWNLSDEAVRAYPADIPMSTFAFPWFRLWIRPFVPDIDALSEAEREYYEKFFLATFNNPARIDMNADMLWRYVTVDGASDRKHRVDTLVLPLLDRAIRSAEDALRALPPEHPGRAVFDDLLDRLLAGRAYMLTMRNTMAWTEAVHGYLQATTEERKKHYRGLCREMVENELQNAKDLLSLWNRTRRDVIPVSETGETLHI
ncbi:MAG: hypothetical protein IT282_17220, partial [Bacteroidetes bacterium]|nr:hypothetical protein [Bacteroidota bacterium]